MPGSGDDPHYRLVDSDGSSIGSEPAETLYEDIPLRVGEGTVESLTTDDQTINDSVTWPDGSTTTTSPGGGGGGLTTTTLTAADSPHTTSDEDVIYADTSDGAITVTLASADATLANEIDIVLIDGTNAVTVETEGSETIDPNAETSKTLSITGWRVAITSDGSNWDAGWPYQDPLAIPASATAVDRGNDGAMAVGPGSEADNSSVALGPNAISRRNSVLVGAGADGTNSKETAGVGQGIDTRNTNQAAALGHNVTISALGGVGIGSGVTVATAGVGRIGVDQLVFGGSQDTIADADLNNGEMTVEMDEANSAFRLRGKDSTGNIREATIPW